MVRLKATDWVIPTVTEKDQKELMDFLRANHDEGGYPDEDIFDQIVDGDYIVYRDADERVYLEVFMTDDGVVTIEV